MLRLVILVVALACISPANAFPLSALSEGASRKKLNFCATQLHSLQDGTYIVVIRSIDTIADLALNPRVRTRPLLSDDPSRSASVTTIFARVNSTNDFVMWAYATDEFTFSVDAVVDGALGIFVAGDATGLSQRFLGGAIGVSRFSVSGEFIMGEVYTSATPGLEGLRINLSAGFSGPFLDLVGARTLVITSSLTPVGDDSGAATFFVDIDSRKVRQIRFPLPDGPPEDVASTGMAADAASGAACFAHVRSVRGNETTQRLFVQCVNAAGEPAVVSRILVPFRENVALGPPNVIITGGGEGETAMIHVVAVRQPVFDFTRTGLDKSSITSEMLLFKLNATTLEDVEWESGRTSTKPTMRKLLLTNSFSGFGGSVTSLEYICNRNTLVVLYGSGTTLSGIETLPDGRILFRGDSARAAQRFADRQWLLYFGNDAEPTAVRIPDNPRPNGEQNDSDVVIAADLELSEDKRDLYLFGTLQTPFGQKRGAVITFSLPLPELA